jgi:hypothetical protein
MPIIDGEERAGSAGIDVVNREKPQGEKIIIKSITVYSSVALTDFTTAYARLEKIAKTSQSIPFGYSIAQSPNKEGHRWDLDQEWYEGWQLEIGYYAQAAGIWYWTVEYDIITEKPEPYKRWWKR